MEATAPMLCSLCARRWDCHCAEQKPGLLCNIVKFGKLGGKLSTFHLCPPLLSRAHPCNLHIELAAFASFAQRVSVDEDRQTFTALGLSPWAACARTPLLCSVPPYWPLHFNSTGELKVSPERP